MSTNQEFSLIYVINYLTRASNATLSGVTSQCSRYRDQISEDMYKDTAQQAQPQVASVEAVPAVRKADVTHT
ncbi:hypothetical protein Tco_1186064 [Tanacetum coccineum]